eukprot:scaffold23434_cov113-Skeletonema_marinoi.AAC.1
MRRMVGATHAAETPETSLSITIAIAIAMNLRVRGAMNEERGWKNRVVALDRELIQQNRDAVNEWKASTCGKQRTALMALRRNRAQT